MNYIGKISYSLYLIHPVAIAIVIASGNYLGGSYSMYWAIPLSLLLAVGGFYLIETSYITINKLRIKRL